MGGPSGFKSARGEGLKLSSRVRVQKPFVLRGGVRHRARLDAVFRRHESCRLSPREATNYQSPEVRGTALETGTSRRSEW